MLPILLSIPHGGTHIPDEVRNRVCITPLDLFNDGDAFTKEIYDLGSHVARVVKTDIARAFVDLNRSPNDRPPQNPDGVVKTATCFARPIYAPGRELDPTLTELLIEKYHKPYHAELAQAAAEPDLKLALDCHSMLSASPPISVDPGHPRPLFCLSNRDDTTTPRKTLENLADAFSKAFEIPLSDIGLNDPFRGGYITQKHGVGQLPWIQVEMNRSLYLTDPWFDRNTLQIDSARIDELRVRFLNALNLIKL